MLDNLDSELVVVVLVAAGKHLKELVVVLCASFVDRFTRFLSPVPFHSRNSTSVVDRPHHLLQVLQLSLPLPFGLGLPGDHGPHSVA